MTEYKSAHAPHPIRAGFWERTLAFGIDLLIVNLLIGVIGLAAAGPTDGRLRVARPVVSVIDCTGSEPLPPQFPIPSGFNAGDAHRCTHSVLGITHDRTIIVREKMMVGEDERGRHEVSIPLDAKGRSVRAFYLDDLIPLVLAAYLLLFEWRFGTTLGKRFVFVRVQSLGGGPMVLLQVGKRVLIRLIVLLSASTMQILPRSSTGSHRITFGLTLSHGTPDLGILTEAFSVLTLAYAISFIITTSRRTLPLHDRWASTEAIRSISPEPQ